jgi:hypothetical protein
MATINPYIVADYLEFDYFLESQLFPTTFTVSVSSPSDQASVKDYTWDDFAESNVIDRTWDEWFGDSWEGGVIFAVTSILKARGGYLQLPTISVSSTATSSVNANYTTGIPQDITAVFEQADTFFDRFRDIVVSGQAQNFDSTITTSVDGNFTTGVPQNITSIFTHSTNANYTTGIPQNISSLFTTSQNANAVFDLGYGQTFNPAFTQSTDGNAVFDLAYGQTFNALYSTLTVGGLIALTDPWNILTVPQETRQFVVPYESLDLPVLQEIRVNKAKTETRSLLVPQETRSYKIRKPIMTSQSVIPRVRVER